MKTHSTANVLPAQVPAIPGGPELFIIFVLLLIPLFAGFLAYRTGKKTSDENALLWAVGIAILTVFGFFPGIVALALYSYSRGTR